MTTKYIYDEKNKLCYEIEITENSELNSFEIIGSLSLENNFSFSAKNLINCKSFDTKEAIVNEYPEYFI